MRLFAKLDYTAYHAFLSTKKRATTVSIYVIIKRSEFIINLPAPKADIIKVYDIIKRTDLLSLYREDADDGPMDLLRLDA